MDPLPTGTSLGRLRLIEVWDYFDGPRLFVAESASHTLYVAFWTDHFDGSDVWMYAAVSAQRLEAIRAGKISLRDAFVSAEDGHCIFVSTRADGTSHTDFVPSSNLGDNRLPPADDYLSLALDSQFAVAPEQPSTHVVLVTSVAGQGPLVLEAVTDVLSRWRELFVETMEALGLIGELTPIEVGLGSFRVALRVDDPTITMRVVERLAATLRSVEGITTADGQAGTDFDLVSLVALLERLEHHDVRLEILVAGLGPLIISPAARGDAERALAAVRLARPLDTIWVPQADDLDRAFRLLDLKGTDGDVNSFSLGVVPRQVAYYQHACRLLGYLDERNELTIAGRQLIGLSHDDRLRTTAVQFEQSECGFAWLRWSAVRTLPEILPESAEAFLQAASTLSPTTARRRARTLLSWHQALAPFHYNYRSS